MLLVRSQARMFTVAMAVSAIVNGGIIFSLMLWGPGTSKPKAEGLEAQRPVYIKLDVQPHSLNRHSKAHQPQPPPIQGSAISAPPKAQPKKTKREESPVALAKPARPLPGATNKPPVYPRSARRKGQEGVVLVRVTVSTKGSCLSTHLQKSSGVSALDRAALKAVQSWRFSPAVRNGQPVQSKITVPIRFVLKR